MCLFCHVNDGTRAAWPDSAPPVSHLEKMRAYVSQKDKEPTLITATVLAVVYALVHDVREASL